MSTRLPEPPDPGLLNAWRFGSDTFRFLEGLQARFEDGTAISLPGRGPLVVLTNPQLVAEALDRPDDFPRVEVQTPAAMIAENGLVQSEGRLWRQQRSIIGPGFGGPQVRAYANTTGTRGNELAAEWSDQSPERINLHRAMTSVTIRAASEVLFDEDIGRRRADRFHEWMQVAGREFEFGLDIALPEWLPTPTSSEFRTVAANIRALSEELIEQRRATLDQREDRPTDMLALLLRVEDDPDVEYPPNQIRDEVATFLIAGHETTALSLTYTLALLSKHPQARQRVRTEARDALGEGPPEHDDVTELPHTKRVYQEALRLYPPAWAVFRRTTRDVDLGSYVIEDGAGIIMPQWSIHRDDRYFDDPRSFDPDRWRRRDPNATDAYFPFSTGPHACIGRGFALSGAPLVLARLIRDFDVDVADDALDHLRVTPTLRPAAGIEATIEAVD